MHGRVIVVGKWLERIWHEWQHALVLIERKPIKQFVLAGDIPIEFAEHLSFAEGRGYDSCERFEGRTGYHWINQILLIALTINVEEELVFNNWTTQAAAELIALKRIVRCGRKVSIQALIAEEIEAFSVEVIRP